MKLVRTILAGVLLISMLLPLVSCGSSLSLDEVEETVTTETAEKETTPVVQAPKAKRYTMKDLQGKLKLLGERTVYTDTGLLALEWVGSGFELTIDAPEGGTDVTLQSRFNYVSYWYCYVDGEQFGDRIYLENGNKDTVIATVDQGVHTIRFVKDTQAGKNRNNYNNIVSLSFFGELLESDQTKKNTYLEFVGDSYFVGYGSIGSQAESATFAEESSYRESLPAIISKELDADYSVVAHSNIGLVTTIGSMTLPMLYHNNNGYRDLTFTYAPTRLPDAIILHVGQEDALSKLAVGDFIIKGEEFISTLRSYYGEAGKDIPVIWIYGTYYYTQRTSEIQAIALRGDNVYAVEGSFGRSGSGPKDGIRYPNAEEHQKTADILLPILKDILGK